MKPQLNRADLLRCLEAHGPEALDNLAAALGFVPLVPAPRPVALVAPGPLPVAAVELPPIPPTPAPRPQARFLRPIARRRLTPEETAHLDEPAEYLAAVPLTEADPAISAPEKAQPPRPLPLMPWPRLWPFLKLALGESLESRRLDVPCLVDGLARGRRLRRLPRVCHAGWARECQLVLDFAEPLRPFWGDFDEVKRRLPPLRGQGGLAVVAFWEGDPLGCCRREAGADGWIEAGRYVPPPPGTPVLVLSDLGCYDPAGQRRLRWLRFGARLQSAGCRPVALMPCPPRRWDGALARLFGLACWDRAARLPRRLGRGIAPAARGEEEAAVGRLLALLSPAIRVEPALLRAARGLLPAGLADVGTEAAVWNHAEVHATLAGFHFDAGTVGRHRERFRAEADLGPRMACLILEHHACLSPVIGLEEAGVLRELLGREAWERGAVAAGRGLHWRLARTCAEAGELDAAARAWMARLGGRGQPEEFWRANPGLEAGWVLAHRDRLASVELPPGVSLQRVAWALGGKREPGWLDLRQRGAALWVGAGSGGFVARLETGVSHLFLSVPGAMSERFHSLEEPLPLAGIPERFRLRTDREEWEFDFIAKPEWARAMGRDRQGLYVDAVGPGQGCRLYWQAPEPGREGYWRGDGPVGCDGFGLFRALIVKGVAQRFRWIAPGRFLMGSPGTEPERFDWELQHSVILTQGYWLADTACTQALWRAVMGDNPSRFKDDPANPVETVSWDDAQEFLARLNQLVPGFDARLPTEAEWEYACRAGTETPFSFGGNITPEQVNYGGNHPYAGGAKGFYREKTVPVKSLPPNPWGLYEMHGNVWEWCADWFGDYPNGEVADPRGPADGASRVLRGGSWISLGRHARSASRHRHDPGHRYDGIGFRLALGPGASGQAGRQASGRAASVRAAERSEGGQDGRSTPARRFFDWFKRK